jgi:hypothetical protein
VLTVSPSSFPFHYLTIHTRNKFVGFFIACAICFCQNRLCNTPPELPTQGILELRLKRLR